VAEKIHELDRREFLKAAGLTGLVLFFAVPVWPAKGDEQSERDADAKKFGGPAPTDFNAYLRVGSDGRVICYTGKIEMGQGVHTSLQQMLADELDVGLGDVEIVMGDTLLCPWDAGTYASITTRKFGPVLRKAGAEARQVLLEMAAARWQVPVESLRVENGVITLKGKATQKISYAELTKGQTLVAKAKGTVRLKTPAEFKFIGKGVSRKDGVAKVTGAAVYAADVHVPGILYARILRPPAQGCKLLSADLSEAEKITGIKTVREEDFVAVLHESPDIAAQALTRVRAQFSAPTQTSDENSIFDLLLKHAPQPKVTFESGNLMDGEKDCRKVFSETYYNDYVAHAPLEPHAATVVLENGEAQVWASTQTPFIAQVEVADELKLPREKVRVHSTFVGGGFGGKSNFQQIVEAARCVRLTGRPVQVAWTREEEFFFDAYRPAAIVKVRAGLDAKGRMALWDYDVYFACEFGTEPFYDLQAGRVRSIGSVMDFKAPPVATHPFAVGPWRAPGCNTNAFARETMIDRMAESIKMDPVQFRLQHMTDPRFQNVLRTAAEKFGWRRKTKGRKGVGVACASTEGTMVAMMAEVEVDPETGEIQVKRVTSAQDMGLVINPRGVRAQMEGSITMGLGYALREMEHFKNGVMQDINFGTYEIPRFSWLPKIETHILDNPGAEALGGGEATIAPVGAVIANAVYDAVRVRLNQMPMNPERVLAALKARGKAQRI
jgi:isoquinoline 1-oxidoreductase